MKTRRNKILKEKNHGKNKFTLRRFYHSNSNSNNSLYSFKREITVVFLETLMMIKLFHWKTTSFAVHKATDEFYSKLNGNIDTFIEVLLGKNTERINLLDHKTMKLIDLSSPQELVKELTEFKHYLVSLTNNPAMKQMSDTDLLNIRDTILGDVNQLLYLLSLH
jgi:DNA-binding ferritin-like protein